jgi:hypothetical protein
MFVTTEHTMSSCFDRFQAIGIGFELANVLARPFAFDDMSEEGPIALAAYILSQVKDNVPGCGGISQFVSMRNDGTVSPEWSLVTDQIQEVACKYDKACHELLFSMVGEDDVEFEKALLALTSTARQLKDRWRGSRNSNPAIAQYLLMTRGGWTPPQPSPESPEGSDEF